MRLSIVIKERVTHATRSYLAVFPYMWMNNSETKSFLKELKRSKSFMTCSKRLTNMSLFL